MKRLMAAIGIVLLVGGIVRAQGTAQDKIYSRQKAFRIPFQIPDPSEQMNLQEVQLYVARNGGKWEKYTSSPPDVPSEKRSFTFRTDQDGEYWFAVRTMDKRGVQNPEDDASMQVGLRVVVDSEVPKIELRPIPCIGREIGVEWEVQDRNLDLDTLKLEYRVEGEETWQAVPGVAPKFFGQATWTPDVPGRVSLRCQVQDRAQNLGIHSCDLEPASLAARQGSTLNQSTNNDSSINRSSQGLKPINRSTEIPVGRQSTPPSYPGSKQTGASSFSGNNPTNTPPYAGSSTKRSSTFGGTGIDQGSETGDELNSQETTQTKPSTKSGFGTRPSGPAAGVSKPANRQIVNDSEVSLDYQIEDEGPSGVSVVELWVTMDMGRTWKRVGEDPDQQSPFTVTLGDDGIYGLTLVAKSGVGLGDRPPVAGDQPQTWVEVDKSPPVVQLSTPEVGKGIDLGNLVITWKADDANMGDRCVSLFYAEDAKNEWKPIITAIENTGRYIWKLNGNVPFKFHVAIEVSDLAGNRGMAESAEVTIDTSKPKPRISGVNSGSNPGGTYRR